MFGKGEGKVFLFFPAGFPVTYDCSTQYRPGVGDALRSARALRWSSFFFSLKVYAPLKLHSTRRGLLHRGASFSFLVFSPKENLPLFDFFSAVFAVRKKGDWHERNRTFCTFFIFMRRLFLFPFPPFGKAALNEQSRRKKTNERGLSRISHI